MEGVFDVWKHRKCKRKIVYFVLDKEKYTDSRHVEVMRAFRQCLFVNKKMDVSIEQC